jgi:hypothetical protein
VVIVVSGYRKMRGAVHVPGAGTTTVQVHDFILSLGVEAECLKPIRTTNNEFF